MRQCHCELINGDEGPIVVSYIVTSFGYDFSKAMADL